MTNRANSRNRTGGVPGMERNWSGEITPFPRFGVTGGTPDSPEGAEAGRLATTILPSPEDNNVYPQGVYPSPVPQNGQYPDPDMENDLPDDVIEAPTTLDEVYRGSMKALLLRNIGNYIVATFLIGTQTTVAWEGVLYDVGNDYIVIYEAGRDQYIVVDLYSLKYVEFYDARRRELCDALLAGNENAAAD